MYATERHAHIATQLDHRGRVSVQDLATTLDVTTETIRRDLAAMERTGRLRRVHGGAVPSSNHSVAEVSIRERMAVNAPVKAAIAQRALDAIGEGFVGSVLFDAGSTTSAIAAALPARLAATGADVHALTHAVPVAHALAAVPDLPLTVLGGQVRGLTAAAVGPMVLDGLSRLRPDLAFIGANGVSADFGLSTPDPAEAAVKEAIVHSARRVVAVADSSKFDVESLVRFAGLEDIDVLVVDIAPSGELSAALDAAQVEVWTA